MNGLLGELDDGEGISLAVAGEPGIGKTRLLADVRELARVLFGIAGYRSGAFPKSISVVIVVGGVIGFKALLAPFAIPLALAVGALGVWMIRSRSVARASTAVRVPAPGEHYAGSSAVA